MKKVLYGILGILLVILIVGTTGFLGQRENENHVKAASYFGSDTTIPDFPEEGKKGSITNPFVILEIVPYEGYAEIGYMIEGCEPIPLEKAAFDTFAGGTLASTQGMTCEWKEEYTESLGEGDVIGNGPGEWQYNSGTGLYVRYRNYFTSKNSFLKYALGVPEDQIKNYEIEVITITPDELNHPENYRLIDRADLLYLNPKTHYGDSFVGIWETYHPDKKIEDEPKNFYSNDLTWETTVRLLEKAVMSDDPAPIIFDVTTFSTDTSYGSSIEPVKYYSNGTKVGSISATGYTTNAAKLYMVMQLMEPSRFYSEYIVTGRVKAIKVKDTNGHPMVDTGIPMTTGYFLELAEDINKEYYTRKTADDAAVWNIHTLLPYHLFENYTSLNGTKAMEELGYRFFTYDGDKTHKSIRHGFYAYNGDNSITQIILEHNINENFYNTEAFDFYQEDRGGVRPTSLTPAEAIYYLLFGRKVPVYHQSKLHVLEIEPCNDFIWDGTEEYWNPKKSPDEDSYNGSAYARQYFASFFPHYTGQVKITTMTSREFVGKVEDLRSTYDMILFGLKDGAMRKNSGGKTIYNDSSLNGKIYLHVGDRIKARMELRGVFGNGDTEDYYRFAGNDITAVKKKELIEFMEAGYPVVLAKGFLSGAGALNTMKIDSNSIICSLAGIASPCLFYEDNLNVKQLEQVLTTPKCRIVFGKTDGSVMEENCYPIVYRDKTKYSGLTDDKIYVNGSDSSYRTLRYRFYIEDHSDTNKTYRINLYIDMNADGKYEPLVENVGGLILLDEDGYAVAENNLKAGVNYTLYHNLEESFYGIIPWKLEIIDQSNTDNRDSMINYCALKGAEASKIHINVLQIMADSGNNLNLAEHSLFQKYTDNLNDYILHMKSITISDYEALCGNGTYRYILEDRNEISNNIKNAYGSYEWEDYDHDGLFNVDILILGFADIYKDIANENALRNLEEYIDKGNTVLFTHDTTSFCNLPSGIYSSTDYLHWGYQINKRFRETLGMDRFGVTSYGNEEQRIAAGKDYTTDGYIQGYSDTILNRMSLPGQYFSNPNFPTDRNIDDQYVTRVNNGQLTLYPYEIDRRFQVAVTHSQYYQLDLECDDIVVWYCLSDNIKDASGKGAGIYSSTPNDARNNYYIYSKGNIIYSGMGHSAISENPGNSSAVMEMKLFINTLLAAYSAAAKNLEIEVTNSNKSMDADGNYYVYVDYDIYNTEQSFGKELTGMGTCQKLKFSVKDYNIFYNKKLTVEYFTVDPINGALSKQGYDTRRLDTNATVAKLDSEVEYYIEVPLDNLNYENKGKTTLIRVTLTYGKDSSKTIISDRRVTLVRRGLFDLE